MIKHTAWYFIFGLLILIASVMRIYDLFHFGYYFDTISTQFSWGESVYIYGWMIMWGRFGFMDYTVLNTGLLGVIYSISHYFFNGNPYGYIVIYKLLLWLYDIITSLGIFEIVKKYTNKYNALVAGMLYYSLPTFSIVSGTWGQQEGIIFMFIIWSIYFGLQQNQRGIILSTLLFTFAYHLKLTALLFAPIYIFLIAQYFINHNIIQKETKRKLFINLTFILIVFLTYEILHSKLKMYTTAPYVLYIGLSSILVYFLYSLKKNILLKTIFGIHFILLIWISLFAIAGPFKFHENYVQVFQNNAIPRTAHNIWYFTPGSIKDSNKAIIGMATPKQISELLIVIVLFPLIYLIYKNIHLLTFQDILLSTATINYVYYYFSVGRIHSRYLFLAVAGYFVWYFIQKRNSASMMLIFILTQISFFITNALIYINGSNNTKPEWLFILFYKPYDLAVLSVLLNGFTTAFLYTYCCLILYKKYILQKL